MVYCEMFFIPMVFWCCCWDVLIFQVYSLFHTHAMHFSRRMDEFCGSRFWDSNTFLDLDDPDVTLCFEKTVLIWTPCAFLWICLPFEIGFLRRSKSSDIPLNWYNISKLIAIIILTALTINDIVNDVFLAGSFFPVDFYSPLIKLFTFGLFFVLTYANLRFGRRSSARLFFFSLFLVIFGAPQFRTVIRSRWSGDERHKSLEFVCYIIYYLTTVVILLMNCFADSRPRITSYPIVDNACPRNQSSFLSQLLFAWFGPLAWKGFRKSLENEDLWELDYSISSAHIVPKFEKHWKKSMETAKKTHDLKIKKKSITGQENVNGVEYKCTSIAPALIKTFGITILFGTILKILFDMLNFASPQILSLLIDFIGSNEPTWKGYLYAIILFLIPVIQNVASSRYQLITGTAGLQIRACLISMISKKALRLSNGARRNFTVGEMVNLMSVDAYRFVNLFTYFYTVIEAPLLVILSIFFLWQILGFSVLAGIAVLLILVLTNIYVISQIKLLQQKQMKIKDRRIELMNRILSGIRVLKLYAWEPSFEKQVLNIRNEEMTIFKRQAYLRCVETVIWSSSIFLASLATFSTYVLWNEKNVLDAKVAFVSLALYNILKTPLNTLPLLISDVVLGVVSVRRIDKFLNSEDISSSNVSHENIPEALIIQNGWFSWDEAEGQPILHDINVEINPGSLVAIVGSVGSGKSSLISAFLGEMYKLSGIVNTKGTIAYVPQQAWIRNASLKDNITFNEATESSYYNEVLEACALLPDLEILPAGDLTEIGEKGINLSGGQKQRVSLARAVYYGADVYLLDDPLSAVDSHVGSHIFDQVIGPNGLLKNKTRVLVTHSVSYLSQVDFIYVMKNGSISESGSFQELLNDNGEFSKFLMIHLKDHLKCDGDGLYNLENVLLEEKITNEKSRERNSMESEGDSSVSVEKRGSVNYKNKKSVRKGRNVDNVMIGEKLIEVEHAQTGNIHSNVYKYYIRCAGISVIFAILFANCSLQTLSAISSMWLSKWSDDTNAITPEKTQNIGVRNFYLSIYAVLGLGRCAAAFFTDFCIRIGCCNSANRLHNAMLFNLLHSPLTFMDVTPVGRILSRFSKDIDVVDDLLPNQISYTCSQIGEVIGSIIIISCSTPLILTVILPIVIVYYFIQRFYVSTSRQLKRLESVSRSPIYSHFLETVVGRESIRAYGLLKKSIKQSEEKVDSNHKCLYLNIVSLRWISLRVKCICNMVIFFAATFMVLDRDNLSPGTVGLSIGIVIQIATNVSQSIYQISEVETNIVSIERIKEYSETPQEAPWKLPNESVPENWPSKGDIEFQDFKVRYREGLPLILKGITFFVDGGQKVGIVGRTGAGKSSLALSLFRIIESAGGKILIDGVDIATLGLHNVRSKLTIIPQDPVLFAGSLRMNLDPFDEYSDDCLWRALELAHLKSYILSLDNGLCHEITDGAENFSVGQRQLICLARALLRKTKILILDEATASVDLETDALIQSTIRSEFKDCTVLTIAHRLNTIMDYDKILVFDEGYVVENDSPQILLQSKDSLFYRMAVDAGLL